MLDIVDRPTTISYERELIICSFLLDFSKGKGSSLQLICNAHTAFLLCWQSWTGVHNEAHYIRAQIQIIANSRNPDQSGSKPLQLSSFDILQT